MHECRRQAEQVLSSTTEDVPLDTYWTERHMEGSLGLTRILLATACRSNWQLPNNAES
jgi:hypothetical protein